MSGVWSAKTRRAPTVIRDPNSLAAVWARTTPATELRSAIPRAASSSSRARATSSSGCEAPRRNEKLVVTASSAYATMENASRKQPMQKPARLRRLALVQSFAVEPEARALAALDAEVVAGERRAGGVVPPFHGDALRPFGRRDLVQHVAPAEAHGRTVRHFGHGLDR